MLSIITVCYNSEKNIKTTLDSIKIQTNRNYEHIIKDGLSTDKTLKILKNFDDENMKFFSCQDNGIYHAFNQALKLCSGNYINFIGSGDLFYNKHILEAVSKKCKETDCDLLYGDLNIFKQKINKKIISRRWRSGVFKPRKLKFGWMPPHPTVFIKKQIIDQVGNFDESFKIAGDYDFLLRVLQLKNLKVAYLNIPMINMEYGGVSQNNLFKSFSEDHKIGVKNKFIFLPFFKRLTKIRQFNLYEEEIVI